MLRMMWVDVLLLCGSLALCAGVLQAQTDDIDSAGARAEQPIEAQAKPG
jgi:hypothetical protein